MFKKNTTYKSEISTFINDLKDKNPNLKEQQLAGRSRLWDKFKINTNLSKNKFSVKQDAYVYFPLKK